MDVDQARVLLLRHRRELEEELARLTAAPPDPAVVSFGKRIGDGTTVAVERLSTTSAARSLAAKAAEVDRALAKLDERSYGRCDGCGSSIPPERLERLPWTALCVSCRSRR